MITVYVLEGENGRRYVGITNDLVRRLAEHGSGHTGCGRLLGCFELLHTEQFPDHVQARSREQFLKSGIGREFLNGRFPRPGPASGG